MSEMYEAASEMDGERLRARILAHMSSNPEYDLHLDEIVSSSDSGLQPMRELIAEIVGPRQANDLRGSVARYLEGFPDNPVLLLLRSIAEILSDDTDIRVATQNFEAALDFASNRYGMSTSETGHLLEELIKAVLRKPQFSEQIIRTVSNWPGADREFLRSLIVILPKRLIAFPGYKLLLNTMDLASINSIDI